MLTILFTDDSGRVQEIKESAALPDLMKKAGTLWVDFFATSDAENRLLDTLFHLHPVAIEDILQESHYPKIDDFVEYIAVVVHGLRDTAELGKLRTAELDMVIGKNWVITHRNESFRGVEDTLRLCRNVEGFLARGAHRVAQAIVDSQATRFVERVDFLDEELSKIDETLFRQPNRQLLRRLFLIKRDLSQLKRIIVPQREVFNRLGRAEFKVIPAADAILFRDVYDHIYRVAETVDALRDLATGAVESYMSLVSHRTNEIVRLLTIISTLILPMTLITGYFGMNFKHMPEFDSPVGQYFVLLFMGMVSAGLLWFFRRKKWI